VEFIRTNEPVALGLTSQQWIAIAMIVVGVIGAWYFGTRGRLRPVIEPRPKAAKTQPAGAASGGSKK
jgi:prolipoprotein diacylglyceryltransferase